MTLTLTDSLDPVRLACLVSAGATRKVIRTSLSLGNSLDWWWSAGKTQLSQLGLKPDKAKRIMGKLQQLDPLIYQRRLQDLSVHLLTEFDQAYPEQLTGLSSPPILLFVRGNASLLSGPALAIVGTRKPSRYGREVTEFFASKLAVNKLAIVSGLAYGIDTIAHQATLSVSGQTIAVLGSGIDQIHPRINQRLAQEIISTGGAIVSEYPPGTPTRKQFFPARNRIIAGLGLATLVTEAAIGSGSLITASATHQLNRPVFAIPGPINQTHNSGSNQLLQNGAILTLKPEDILTTLALTVDQVQAHTNVNTSHLSPLCRTILELLHQEPSSIDHLQQRLNCPTTELASTLTELELSDLITVKLGVVTIKLAPFN